MNTQRLLRVLRARLHVQRNRPGIFQKRPAGCLRALHERLTQAPIQAQRIQPAAGGRGSRDDKNDVVGLQRFQQALQRFGLLPQQRNQGRGLPGKHGIQFMSSHGGNILWEDKR